MKNPPSARSSRKYCHFHKDNGHHTDECRALKQVIENLIKQGHFKEYVDNFAPVQGKDQGEPSKKLRDDKGVYSVGVIFGRPHLVGNSQGSQERYARVVLHDPIRMMSTMQRPPKVRKEEEISFSEKDAARLYHPYDDALIITPLIGRCNLHRVLMDNRSVMHILFQ
ncbi:uncharacterized protein LOC116134124 [Pistacia vera]|uniref:uncharacterized protein LOC116134124 n=1 Tax=Pistacia vera TaxID=55513 RepID=UPI001263230B|nr:uncharacterized protein LOC116134124 [Pistacia vera]